jgi:hypothetical protein
MLTWAHARGVTLRLSEPGKPTQDAYIESFNGRCRDECLNEHWFTSVAHAQAVIETWRREYDEERPKKGLGGLTPAAYGRGDVNRITAQFEIRSSGERGRLGFGYRTIVAALRGRPPFAPLAREDAALAADR